MPGPLVPLAARVGSEILRRSLATEAGKQVVRTGTSLITGGVVKHFFGEKEGEQIPKDMQGAFNHVATSQRGAPENQMLKVQRAAGGGVVGWAAEHIGDITHRLTNLAGSFGSNSSGRSDVMPKVDRMIKALTQAFGFKKEADQNAVNNAKSRGVSVDIHNQAVRTELKTYAEEHKKVPVYNKIQWLARQAAISLGEEKFDDAALFLKGIKRIDEEGKFHEEAMTVFRDHKGGIVPYKPGIDKD